MGSKIQILHLNSHWTGPSAHQAHFGPCILIFIECIKLQYFQKSESSILKLIWSFSKSSLAACLHCYLSSKRTDWNILIPVQFPLNEKEEGFNLPHCQERERRRCTPVGPQCIILVNILMYVWEWSKGKIPSETKVSRDADVNIYLSSSWWDVHTSFHTYAWIINTHTA